MSRLTHFIELRRTRLPVARCWQMSGLQFIAKKAAHIAAFLLCAIGCLYLMSDAANAIGAAADNKSAATIKQQQQVIDGMSRILDACLSDSTGKPVAIDGQMYLCGIVYVGPAE